MNAEPNTEQQRVAQEDMLLRMNGIENHLHQIETRLDATSEFNTRLDGIHTILETVIRFITPDQINHSSTESITHADGSTTETGFRVIGHVRRPGNSTQLISETQLITDMPWPDAWSVRLFVTALLQTLTRRHNTHERRCWCEVWTPDETGDYVDSAVLNPATGAIEWESDIIHGTEPS